MNVPFHVTPDARLDLDELDPRLQEDVYDVLEAMADDPVLRVPPPTVGVGSIYVMWRVYDGAVHVVRLSVRYDAEYGRVYLLGAQRYVSA